MAYLAACNDFRNTNTGGEVETLAKTPTVCSVARDSTTEARFVPSPSAGFGDGVVDMAHQNHRVVSAVGFANPAQEFAQFPNINVRVDFRATSILNADVAE